MKIENTIARQHATKFNKEELDEMMAANLKLLNEQKELEKNATLPKIEDTYTKTQESEVKKQSQNIKAEELIDKAESIIYKDKDGKVLSKNEEDIESNKEIEDIDIPTIMPIETKMILDMEPTDEEKLKRTI